MSKPKAPPKPRASSPAARRQRGLKQVVFWWPAEAVEALDEEAKRRGTNRARLVAHLLEKGSER